MKIQQNKLEQARRYLKDTLEELRTGKLILGIDHVQLALDALSSNETESK